MAWEGLDEVVAIADSGSFVRGAARLGVSTSHISRVVARLEERVGARLFHRTTRKVALTETGTAFVERCRHLIQEREDLLSQASGSSEPQGELRITCSTALGERFVAPIVRRFTEAHPRLSVNLDLTNRVVDVIAEGYDIGIRTRHVTDTRLVGRHIASRPIEVCASPDYLAAAGSPQCVDDLKDHACLVGTSRTWHFLERGVPKLFTPRGRWRCNSGAAVLDAAIAGMGICQLPEFYVRPHIDAGRLIQLLASVRGEPERIWVVYPQRRQLLPKIRQLADALEAELQSTLNAPQMAL